MKLISANKLNRLWNNGVVAKMVAKTKILKTLEEIEANTSEENVAGATALKEVNNNLMFPDGAKFYPDIKNGERGYNTDPARGADTFVPFNSFRGVELICTVRARFYNSGIPTKRDLFTCTVTVTIDKNGNVTLPQEMAMARSGLNVPTPNEVYFSIVSMTVNFL